MNIQSASSSFQKRTFKLFSHSPFDKSSFSQKYHEYNSIRIVNKFSVNYSDLEFINFLTQEGSDDQKDLLQELNLVLVNANNFLQSHFEVSDLETRKVHTDRVLKIINRQNNGKINEITELIKCKSKQKPEFQIYLKCNNYNNTLEIYLIDLYHLGLPGDLHTPSGTIIPYNSTKIYNKRNKTTTDVCISTLLTNA